MLRFNFRGLDAVRCTVGNSLIRIDLQVAQTVKIESNRRPSCLRRFLGKLGFLLDDRGKG